MPYSAAASPARTFSRPFAPIHRASALAALLLSLFVPLAAFSQSPPPPAAQAPPPDQPLPRVTTTVVVRGQLEDNYLPENISVGSLDAVPLKDAPVSAVVITRDVLSDQVSRLLSDVVKNNASVGDDYVPVGYYGDYQIRGFALDLATGLKINGLTIAGEQDVPLENKQAVEILNGLAGVDTGIASGGGLINYVTKRPALMHDLDLATDHRGSAYAAVDLGRFFGAQKQVGARLNLAGEKIQSYMIDTNGWRAVSTAAVDWRINSRTLLKNDFEYQHKAQRDGSGYQLLGGTTLPDIARVHTSTLLGRQPWGLPDTYDTFNANSRLDLTLSPNFAAFASASLSHSLIDDNVIYAYGTPFDSNGNVACPGAPNAPAYFFCPDGSYGIYDYRDPGELRIDAVAEAVLAGHIKSGALTHDLTLGTELFLRSVQQPGAPPSNAPSTVQDGAVYSYVGAENIYQPIAPIPIESPLQSAGPRTLWEDSHQSSLVLQDRIHLPGRVQLIAGGRYDGLRDHNYSLTATSPGTPPTIVSKPVWLPQFAVTYNPLANLTLYSNYGVLLSLGPQAPWWVDNANQFLAPFNTRQAEVGAKFEPAQRILLTAAFFRMRAPFVYPKLLQAADSFCPSANAGDPCFESQGRETHSGIELNAEGKPANWLRLTGSAAALRAISSNTGTPAFDNKQVLNVPRLHTNLFADLAVPHLHGLHLMPGFSYSARKQATRDDTVSIPAANIFNLGARYTPGGEQGRITFNLYANNIRNKRYWSDTGASLGDSFLWLGAPTTVRLSAHYTF